MSKDDVGGDRFIHIGETREVERRLEHSHRTNDFRPTADGRMYEVPRYGARVIIQQVMGAENAQYYAGWRDGPIVRVLEEFHEPPPKPPGRWHRLLVRIRLRDPILPRATLLDRGAS